MVAEASEARAVDYTLYRQQHAFVASKARFTAFIGGVGSGKTYAGAVKALVTMLQNPSWKRGIVIAPTYQMLLDATWEVCLEVWAPFISSYVKTPNPAITLTTGQVILFRSAENPERLRGPNLWWAWIDEGAYCHKNVWTRLIARLRAGGVAGPCWITTTPNQMNWVADLVMGGSVVYFTAETRHNPYVSKEFVRALYDQYEDQLAEQELAGRFIRFGAGLIKEDYLKLTHYSVVPRGLTWYRYWDLALSVKATSDFTASVRLAFDENECAWFSRPILFRAEWPEVRTEMLATMRIEEGETPGVGIESNAFQLAAVQEIIREPEARDTGIFPITSERDKLARALPWIGKGKNGRVFAVEEPLNYSPHSVTWSKWIQQLTAFPEGAHDDAVDAMSGAWYVEKQMPRIPKVRVTSTRRAA